MFGVDEVRKEYGAISLPIELQAATTEGSSMHIGTMYYLLLMTMSGTTANGSDSLPITFSIIVSAFSIDIPPSFNADSSSNPFILSEMTETLAGTDSL